MVGDFFQIGRVELTDDFHQGRVVVPDERGQAQMPSGLTLDGVVFSRDGDDLVLSWAKAPEVTIAGFFVDDQLADLVFPEGLRLAGGIAAQFAEPLTPEGAPAIARVLTVEGSVDVVRQDKRLSAAPGVEILPGDLFEVRDGSSLAIGFPKRAVLAAGAGSRFGVQVVDAHSVSVVQGVLILADAGRATDLMLDTPLGTIRPQGARAGVDISDGRSATVVHLGGPGLVEIANGRGGTSLKEVQHFTRIVAYDQDPSSVGRMDHQTVGPLFGSVIACLPPAPAPAPKEGGSGQGGKEAVSAKLTPKPKTPPAPPSAQPKPSVPPVAKPAAQPQATPKAPPAPTAKPAAKPLSVKTKPVVPAPKAPPKVTAKAAPKIAAKAVPKPKPKAPAKAEPKSEPRASSKEEAKAAPAAKAPPKIMAKATVKRPPAKPAAPERKKTETKKSETTPPVTKDPETTPPVTKAPPSEAPAAPPPPAPEEPEGWTGQFVVGGRESARHGGTGTDFLYGGEGDGRLIGGLPDGTQVYRRDAPDPAETEEKKLGERVILR